MPGSPPHGAPPRRREALARPIAAGLMLPEAHVGRIEHSHERCQALGLSRIGRPDHAPLGRSDLTVVRDRNQRLYAHAAPVMEMLFDQIVGTESMVVLCDATGTIIHSVGDDDFLARASKVALQPGVNWSEQAKGTNAIGTALIDEVPTLVHADEHYMHANHFLTCSAAPILDPRGNILGVLDVTGDHRSYHQHTMALVKMSARMIENHWLSDDFRNAMRLHFHARVEFIGTLMEGILAVSPDGRIVGANRSALDQLRLSGAALRKQSLASLFGTTVGALVDRFRSPLATPLAVRCDNGRGFHLHARFDWPVWRQVTEAAAAVHRPVTVERVAPVPVVAPPARADETGPGAAGLAQLQTGDPRMDAIVARARRVLDRDIPLLILGETGTGKEVLARAIHRDSARARRAFVVVNCGAIPANRLEAELFGSEAGADADAPGRILQADGGTLFLDDVGELPLPHQARLLQVLQERCVARPGHRAPVPVDLAIVCATRRDLRGMAGSGAFREDLYYRLNGLALKLPPLRERSDLGLLVRRLLDNDAGSRHLQLAAEVAALFEACDWPGNLRQLGNVLRAAAVVAGPGPLITAEHLPEDFLDEARRGARAAAAPVPQGPASTQPLLAVEVEAIRRAVEAAGGNISEASKRLGVSRNTIYRRLRGGTRPPG